MGQQVNVIQILLNMCDICATTNHFPAACPHFQETDATSFEVVTRVFLG